MALLQAAVACGNDDLQRRALRLARGNEFINGPLDVGGTVMPASDGAVAEIDDHGQTTALTPARDLIGLVENVADRVDDIGVQAGARRALAGCRRELHANDRAIVLTLYARRARRFTRGVAACQIHDVGAMRRM